MNGADARISDRWECTSTDPGVAADPSQLETTHTEWIAADVPGTAAGALRDQGAWKWGVADSDVLDGRDWWFRCRFGDPGGGPWLLRLRGLATIADVWLNGAHLLHSENMFLEHEREIADLEPANELHIRFAALDPLLARRRPRPRWKTRLVRSQNLRWIRTTLLGRMNGWAAWAAPVGPWRPVELVSLAGKTRVVDSAVDARCVGSGGTVTVRATLAMAGGQPTNARVRVGREHAPLRLARDGEHVTVEGTLTLAHVERWWPHTHGSQPRYRVSVEIAGETLELATVGFRTIEVDRGNDGFEFVVNDVPVFFRGAVWVPPDVVSFSPTPERLRESLELMRRSGMNMVRLAGHATYESPAFWDICDELGIMVWQDCMLASFDPPDDEEFSAVIEAELTQVLSRLQGRPALALVCGSSETYQQAAMLGLAPGSWESPTLETVIPAVVERVLPDVSYIPSSPIGGLLPFDPSIAVGHYFGVGAYERPLSDARLAGVRFAAACLAFSVPPERDSVSEMFGPGSVAESSAHWKAGVARDSGVSWDFADVRDFYVRSLFDRDPLEVRATDPDWALDLGRAAVAEAMYAVMAEWRRPGSRCSGGLVLSWQDLWPGAGWGLVDTLGRAKAPLYALRRALDPITVIMTDEGLSGLQIHVVNDRPSEYEGRLDLAVYADNGLRVEHAQQQIEVGAHGARTISATEMLGGFRDLTRAYRFGPPAHDVVRATLTSAGDGSELDCFYLPLGRARERHSEIGLTATARPVGPREWALTIATRQFAQWIAIDVPGWTPSDSWFHLAPGDQRTITLRTDGTLRTDRSDPAPRGDVRALNARASSSILVHADDRPIGT